MKNFLLALMVVLTTCTLAVAQTTVVRDSIGKVKVTVTKDNKANTNNTAVTVIGVDTADADSADVNANSSNVSTPCLSVGYSSPANIGSHAGRRIVFCFKTSSAFGVTYFVSTTRRKVYSLNHSSVMMRCP